MRPIRLTLAGLHSFRKAQTIDFSQVSDAGVFGIFGPTGSGKSTILDAITLALFGNVERSDKNRVGIINQQEEKIHAKLSFELNDKSYTVERVYSRNGDLRVKSTLARLTVLENGEEVALADKENEVTKSIESLLGLEVKDFTRAVILPQGKFAEFLTLKSQERRPMLERLFHLNDYGKKLKDRTQAKENTLKKERDEIVAKQEMLQHATKEKVDEEKVNLKQLEAKRKKTEEQLILFLNSFQQIEEKWKLTQKLEEIQTQLQFLKQKESLIQQLELKKDKAERAGKLENVILNYERLFAKQQELQKTIEELTEQYQDIVLQEQTEKQLYDQAKTDLEQKGPELSNQLFQLKEAVGWEQEIEQFEREIEELQTRIKNLQEDLENSRKNSEKNKEQLERANTQHSQLKEEIQSIFVSSEERIRVDEAWEIRNQILDQQKLMDQYFVEKDKARILMEQKERFLTNALEELNKHQNKIRDIELKQDLTERFAPISQEEWHKEDKLLLETQGDIDRILITDKEVTALEEEKVELEKRIQEISISIEEKDKLFNEKDQLLQELLRQIEEMQRNDLIRQLTLELEAGKPCTVCGSTTHTHSNENHSIYQSEEKLKILDEQSKDENEQRSKLLIEKSNLVTKKEILEEQLNNIIKLIKDKQAILHSIMNKLPSTYQQLPVVQLEEKFGLDKTEHQKLQEKITAYLMEQVQDHQQILKIEDQIQKISSEQQVLKSEITYYLQRQKEVQAQIEQGQNKIDELYQRWEQIKGEWDFETLALLREEIKRNDQRKEGLEKQIQSLEIDLKKLEEIKQQLTDTMQQQQLEKEYQIHALNEKRTRLDVQRKKLEQITHGKKAKQSLMETEQKLEDLKNQVNIKEEIWKKVNIKLAELDKQVATEIAVVTNVNDQLNETNLELTQKLKEGQWEDIAEVKNAMMTVKDLTLLVEETQNYYNQRLYSLEQEKEIQTLLNGKQITESEWNTAVQEKEEKVHMMEELKVAISKKSYEVDQLGKEYSEWSRLENKRKEIQHELDIASELNRVLKGNALVDFVAQEYLRNITRIASDKLLQLTRNRYSLDLDQESGFTIVDHTNAGLARPVQSLSGGETFITSLALALALSSQIQLKGGQPLQFFFLDEGFGTLDGDLLDTVMMTLEKLQAQHMTIGIISHVPELQNRLLRKIMVHPPDAKGTGSIIKIES